MHGIYSYSKDSTGQGQLTAREKEVVEEFPLVLNVNGREIATLIASPHDLRCLAVGFLRLQGFVERMEDFNLLSVCSDFGMARVEVKGELPEKLKPVLTSGCGTGIAFTIPQALKEGFSDDPGRRFSADEIFAMMNELGTRAQRYRSHGGMHSAAAGDGSISFFSEDLGRHNTIDRIAGEALIKGIDLHGMMLVTSGRISTELVAKSALLGMPLIASRTSPTNMAIKMAESAGITLVGYVRGGRFEVYTHRERLQIADSAEKVKGVTGVILAGGAASRMGSNKALLPQNGVRFIEGIYRTLEGLFEEVIVVTNTPEQYAFLPCRKVPDLYPGKGVLAGIHSGLMHSETPAIFTVACDMPSLNAALIRHLCSLSGGMDLVISSTDRGFEPLHALYGKGCLPALEELLQSEANRRVIALLSRVQSREVHPEEIAPFDPEFSSFDNINTPEDYFRLRNGGKEPEKKEKESPYAPGLRRSEPRLKTTEQAAPQRSIKER
jgi:FdhD protein